MGWDVRCAVCGGPPFHINLADKSHEAKTNSEDEDSGSNLGSEETDQEEVSNSGSDSDYGDSYDLRVVSEAETRWTESVVLLGSNTRSTAIDKMYFTGKANYEDYGSFNVDSCEDPNFPEDDPNTQCYYVFDATQTPCYPIHLPCLRILCNVLYDTEDPANIDKDVLYHTMFNLHSNMADHLDLDYGIPEDVFDQYWRYKAGAEMLVVDPFPLSATIKTVLREAFPTQIFTSPPPTTISSNTIGTDPFSALPYDVAHELLLLLPIHTVLDLCTASYPIRSFFGPSNRTFWETALEYCMPWFWELHALLCDGSIDFKPTDFKGLAWWVNQQTLPRDGLRGPFMGIANRRRIWDVCEQLADDYLPLVALKSRERIQGSPVAESIWDQSVNIDMPAVVWPKPAEKAGIRTSAVQWISVDKSSHSMERGGVFETYWDKDGSLRAMCLTVAGASERRLCGISSEMSKEEVILDSDIVGLVVCMQDIFRHEQRETSIKGIIVHTASGLCYPLGDTSNAEYCQRFLNIESGYALTGVVGHITKDGHITRLGLVQHPLEEADNDKELEAPLLLRPLWKPPSLATSNALHNTTTPIWSQHPRIRAIPSTTRILDRYMLQSRYHEDIVPTDVLIWAADTHELRSIQRISAYQQNGRRHIGAIRVDFAAGSNIPARMVGEEAGRRLVQGFNPTWDNSGVEGSWKALEIDGATGEVVVAVDVVQDEDIKMVKLRTNRGREMLWGEEPQEYALRGLEPMVPADGETIIGLAVGFVYPGYGSTGYTVELSTVSALTMALEA
ncbi:putative f-box domain protein [Favolaschia claudopus]|uniref:F-box domain protein n=1 Tax=Favolaschia claudopus TaxID=2862362 RepID=A0AAW0E6J4_9AGAR